MWFQWGLFDVREVVAERQQIPPTFSSSILLFLGSGLFSLTAEKDLNYTNTGLFDEKGEQQEGHDVNPGSSHNHDDSIAGSPFTGSVSSTTGCWCSFNITEQTCRDGGLGTLAY